MFTPTALITQIYILLFLVSSQALSQGSCITNCIAEHPDLSACNGTETGKALADCECATYSGYNDPLLECIRGCPSSDVVGFATNIPGECRATLLPDVIAALATSTGDSATAAAASSAGLAGRNQEPAGLSVIVVTVLITVWAL